MTSTTSKTKPADSSIIICTIREKDGEVIIIERKQQPQRIGGIDV